MPVQNSKLWRLTEGEDGKGEREEGERTGRGANKRERDKEGERERERETEKEKDLIHQEKKILRDICSKRNILTETRPFQTEPEGSIYVY